MSKLPIPIVSGISPHQGTPGTQVTIRGENLGYDANDLVALIICGTDCLVASKWKSSSKIIARVGQAKRGVGDIVIVTRSGGRGISNVQFRVFIEDIGPLQETSVWVDESRTVPGRNVVRNVIESSENEDALGLRVDAQRKYDPSYLSKMFPEQSGNLRLENFSSAWYLLENHQQKSLSELQAGMKNIQGCIMKEEETSKNLHKANLNALINCATAMDNLYTKINENSQMEWPMTKTLAKQVEESRHTADKLFREVLRRKDHADAVRNALSVLTRFRFIFFLAESIDENMAKGEYSTILNDYTRAKSLFKDTDVTLFKEIMVVLDTKIESVRQSIRQKLIDIPDSFETQSKLIKYLKILDSRSDPTWDCITAYHCWLEDLLWKFQDKYHQMVLEEDRLRLADPGDAEQSNGDFATTLASGGYRYSFITELLAVLTEKLDAFSKLSQSYSVEDDDKFQEKRDDIDGIIRTNPECFQQMLKNTINVSSWLLLNALVPSSLPEMVAQQYAEKFAVWPKPQSTTAQLDFLSFSLRSLRTSIKLLIEHQFTCDQVQPLVELSMTIRLKCLGLTIENGSEAIVSLASRENWKVDMMRTEPKTALPDLYATEIGKILPSVRQILSAENFPGEVDLFTRERICQMIIDLFVILLLSYKDCCDRLIQLRPSATEGKLRPTQEITSRKLLITLCNVEYVIRSCLPAIAGRLVDRGVKFCDVIMKKTNQKLATYRHALLKQYITAKSLTVDSLLDVADYEQIPDEEDVSDFIKELIMCTVFIQAELCLIFPQLTRQVLSLIIQKILDGVLKVISKANLSPPENATQAIIDLTALEEAFQLYLAASERSMMNSVRSQLMGRMDRESFQSSMQTFRHNLEMAIESLQTGDAAGEGTFAAVDAIAEANAGGAGFEESVVHDDDEAIANV